MLGRAPGVRCARTALTGARLGVVEAVVLPGARLTGTHPIARALASSGPLPADRLGFGLADEVANAGMMKRMPTAGTTMPESLITVPTARSTASEAIAARIIGYRRYSPGRCGTEKRRGSRITQNTPAMITGSRRVIQLCVRMSMFIPILRMITAPASPLRIESKKRPKCVR